MVGYIDIKVIVSGRNLEDRVVSPSALGKNNVEIGKQDCQIVLGRP